LLARMPLNPQKRKDKNEKNPRQLRRPAEISFA
jgi:hypothetical protein